MVRCCTATFAVAIRARSRSSPNADWSAHRSSCELSVHAARWRRGSGARTAARHPPRSRTWRLTMDGYHVALVVHLLTLVAAGAVSAIVHLAESRGAHAATVGEAMPWHRIAGAAAKYFPII